MLPLNTHHGFYRLSPKLNIRPKTPVSSSQIEIPPFNFLEILPSLKKKAATVVVPCNATNDNNIKSENDDNNNKMENDDNNIKSEKINGLFEANNTASPFSKAISQIDISYVQKPPGYKKRKGELYISTRLIYKILTKIGRPSKQMPLQLYCTRPQISHPKCEMIVEIKNLKNLPLEPLLAIYEIQADFMNGGCWHFKKGGPRWLAMPGLPWGPGSTCAMDAILEVSFRLRHLFGDMDMMSHIPAEVAWVKSIVARQEARTAAELAASKSHYVNCAQTLSPAHGGPNPGSGYHSLSGLFMTTFEQPREA